MKAREVGGQVGRAEAGGAPGGFRDHYCKQIGRERGSGKLRGPVRRARRGC